MAAVNIPVTPRPPCPPPRPDHRRSSDVKHLRLAHQVAAIFSKDPTTAVGAIVQGEQPNELAIGYNGLPPGLTDDARLHDREWKNAHVRHAEANALSNAVGFRPRRIFSTHYPCLQCALAILAARTVCEVVTVAPSGEYLERWGERVEASRAVFREAGIRVREIAAEDL